MEETIIKIGIIYGENLVDGKNRNGRIDYIECNYDDDFYHIFLMIKYLKSNYKDNELLQSYNLSTTINKIALTLCNLGDVVFLNTTSYKKDTLEKYGKTGVVIIPECLTDEQRKSLRELKIKLEEYREIQIWYNIDKEAHAQMKLGDCEVIEEFINLKTR